MITLTPCAPEHDAIRTYTVSAPSSMRGRFLVSLHTRNKRTERNSWSVHDLLTGALLHCWNRRECVEAINRMTTPPTPNDARFLTIPRQTTPVEPEDLVLIDRSTGRWWLRHGWDNLPRDIAVLAQLTA